MDDACFIKQTKDEIFSLDKSILELKVLMKGIVSHAYKNALQHKKNDLEETKKSLLEFLERYAPIQKQELLPVFCLADSKNLLTNNIKISQFKDFIAFDYGIQINLGTIFCSSSEKEFKKFVSSAPCLHENKETLNPHNASQIYSAMKTLTDNIGKPIVIAVGKGMGGGLELRKIIGPYKFVESGIKTKSGNLCYFHQFPTEFIRKLTPEESQKVSNARKYQFSLIWNVEIVI
jgi:hypothetical protein